MPKMYAVGCDLHRKVFVAIIIIGSAILSKSVAVAANRPTVMVLYAEIMKALYKAKDRREGMLSTAETELLAHADAVLAKYPPTDPHHIAFRIVRGQCYLKRVFKAVAGTKRGSHRKAPRRPRSLSEIG